MAGKAVAGVHGVLVALLKVDPKYLCEGEREARAISAAVNKHPHGKNGSAYAVEMNIYRWMQGLAVP